MNGDHPDNQIVNQLNHSFEDPNFRYYLHPIKIDYAMLICMARIIKNMTENFQSKSARTLYIYINMSTA